MGGLIEFSISSFVEQESVNFETNLSLASLFSVFALSFNRKSPIVVTESSLNYIETLVF